MVLALGGLCLAWAWLGAAGMLLCAIGARFDDRVAGVPAKFVKVVA